MVFNIATLLHHPEEGFYPAFPEEVSFLLLAESNRSARWALYQCDQVLLEGEGYVRAPQELEQLLASAEEYPPALALARDELKWHPLPEDVTQEEFIAIYSDLIQTFLNSLGSDGFIQAMAVADELGYLTPGELYWILQYHPEGFADKVLSSNGDVLSICRYHPAEGTVSWVSDDYHIYCNPASHFDLSQSQLKGFTPSSVSPPRPQRAAQTPPNPPHTDQ
jgi:hypothetical protein